MKLIEKKEISPEICYDISVKNNNNFFANGLCVHNSNAGIHFEDGVAYPQKRSDFITVHDDNAGFAAFVNGLTHHGDDISGVIIYGEWAGPGIQKNDAVTKIPNKSFFVFSILDIFTGVRYHDPNDIEGIIQTVFGKDYENQNIYVLPWETEEYQIDFTRQGECQCFVDAIMKTIDDEIAEVDPYIERKFGVTGPGEGLVMYGLRGNFLDGTPVPKEYVLDYIFKAKTEAHTVQKEKNRNHVAPEKPDGIEDFIEMFFTEARFEQMLNQIGGVAEREKTGQFMKAIMSDVYKESQQEILISDFQWKDVPKYAAPVVKEWWFRKCNELHGINEK